MKALYFLNFWRATTQKEHRPSTENNIAAEFSSAVVYSDDEFYEGEDSLFELECTLSDFDRKKISNNLPSDTDKNEFDFIEEALHKSSAIKTDNGESQCSQPALSLSPTDHVSKRQVLPVEPIFKPQSPISVLRSAPKFSVMMFKNPKLSGVFVDNNAQTANKQGSEVKFEKSPQSATFTRDNSLRMHKYLKVIKPLYVKLSKKLNEKMKLSEELSMSSASSSPAAYTRSSPKNVKQGNIPAGIGVVGKHLGKSRSSSSMAGVSSVSRRDDSLQLQQDGIQSAIQHCKRSYNLRDYSLLSRSVCDSMPEKLIDSPRISTE
ncbi:hypothetical protein K2173_028356 [Erythroxylum novogranatense]|uniref:Membrane-associated kinase regulator 5 n=1 Tax=Erythroxylum novogranatense TaxID=1862640 RepID=A0AAV8U4N8_9ROSI|nr:hypothetical protein K2173_028356 [Erythroxylum novogranatense]